MVTLPQANNQCCGHCFLGPIISMWEDVWPLIARASCLLLAALGFISFTSICLSASGPLILTDGRTQMPNHCSSLESFSLIFWDSVILMLRTAKRKGNKKSNKLDSGVILFQPTLTLGLGPNHLHLLYLQHLFIFFFENLKQEKRAKVVTP